MDRKTAKEKARALLRQMTPEEKVAQMLQVSYAHAGREEALRWARLGVGSFLHVLGDDARELQAAARETRLGIPVIFGIDAIHGHGLNEHATIFPSQLAAACSWNPETLREMGEVTAREVASDGLHWTFSPVLCLGRDTRWGRMDETFGEDAYLAGELGAAIVRGYQGDDLADGEHILACAKHYLGYGEATGGRDAYDTEVTERKVREVFLPPFRKAAEAGCATIMTAYGSIDGTPLTAHRRILHDLLRDELGFDGFVVTDWDNVKNLVTRQHTSPDLEHASVTAVQAGNDMIMYTVEFYDAMLKAIREGRADMAAVDEAVLHILTVKYEMELFEKPEKTGRPGCLGCPEHLDAALRAARAGVTLLRNNGMLPLKKDIRKVAVIGANADDLFAQYGDWTYFTHPLPTDHAPVRPYVTLKEGVEALCREQGIEFVYAKGCSVRPDESDDPEEAVRAAESADAVIYTVGDVSGQFGEYCDRADLALTGMQTELFRRIKATGKPVCTVLIATKPLCLGDTAEQADAVICGFNGGMFGGQAIAEVLFGKISPSGRLPVSFPRHSGQLPVHYTSIPGWHGEKYNDLPETPLFTFGEGLGYTSFAYSGLSVDENLVLTVQVTNTGSRPGRETVQVYLRDCVASVMTPVRRLIAFRQADLAPGETAEVRIPLQKESFALINAACEQAVEPGEFILYAGHSSKESDLISTKISL